MMAVYSLVLTAALVVSAPWWMARMLTTARYREGLLERLGAVPARLRVFAAGRQIVWLHAVSVGEVLAASRLVPDLEAALPAAAAIVISTTTRTGQALARARFGDERVFYMPFDFAFAVRAFMRRLSPRALILMESELWPRLLHECVRKNIPVAVVNARVSDRSFARAMRIRAVWSRILRLPSLWLAQSEQDAQRLKAMGALPARVRVIGNLKYDVRAPQQSRIATLIAEVAGGRRIIVAGSTFGDNPPEDAALIRAQQSLPADEKPLLVLAPRHPENFDHVYAVASEHPTLRATDLLEAEASTASYPKRAEIIVLDTVGDLAGVYGIADIAFVGGSLVRRGGHNPLEPAQFGVPVVMGPSFENFRGIMEAMRAADAIAIVERTSGASLAQLSSRDVPEDLARGLVEEICRLLRHPDQARAMGERGRQVFEAHRGATARAVDAIVSMVNP